MSYVHNKRNRDALPVGEAIEQLMKVYRLQGAHDRTLVQAHWEELVGPAVARRTKSLRQEGKKLFVEIDSAPLREEMRHARAALIERIARDLGPGLIEEIHLK